MDTHSIERAFLFANFKYIKVELEAHVEPEDYQEQVPCENCDEGRIECDECSGHSTVSNECSECEGSGNEPETEDTTCSHCSGDCTIDEDCYSCDAVGYHSCDYCSEGYIDNDDWQSQYCEDFEQYFKEQLNGMDDCFKYLSVYHDGSVDTEATFTLRVDYLDKLPEIVKIFKDTCLHFGSCQTENAGLHITLLEGYQYPRESKLDEVKIENYKKHVSKLLFGLIYLGSNGDMTRSFQYRDIQLADKNKYSAIYTHDDTCIEFRLFDSCFEQPERILQYMAIIAKTLKYYTANPKKAVGIHNTVTVEASDKILKKHRHGQYVQLTEVYNTRQSRMRLFSELQYLVSDKGRRILQDLSALHPCLIAPELFTIIKQF